MLRTKKRLFSSNEESERGGQELIFLALIILLLFGGKKIPELMKGLGKGGKSFKDGMNGIDETVEETVNPENKKSDTEK